MTYRTKTTEPDFRREPKTRCYCAQCQRDIKPGSPELYTAMELDRWPEIIHPADIELALADIRPRRSPHHHFDVIQFERVGPECARRIGKEWVLDAAQHAEAVATLHR